MRDPLAISRGLHGLVEAVDTPAVRPRHDEPQFGVACRHEVESADERGQVLARLHGPDREHVTGGAREGSPRRRVRTRPFWTE